MFNVNHFIISQANPHAVMFASYNTKAGVWTNPLTGFIHSIVSFLKDQVRAWLSHFVECLGARRIAPLFETERGAGTQFFTQEYEGRSCDISLVPWSGHRGLFSAMLHVIYNPSKEEFREWIAAAERETWKYIPAIKSHIAEEITLDLCVQRLRKRLMIESWEKDSGMKTTQVDRVPSFFTSASLVNLSGQSVADQQAKISVATKPAAVRSPVVPPKKVPSFTVVPDVDINSGWGGMGLRGNRSNQNLTKSSSAASGLFIDDEENVGMTQDAGEKTGTTVAQPKGPRDTRAHPSKEEFSEAKGYVKTATMANFYYRNASKNPAEDAFARIRKTTSDPFMDKPSPGQKPTHHRKKSQSHTAISSLHDEIEQMSSDTNGEII